MAEQLKEYPLVPAEQREAPDSLSRHAWRRLRSSWSSMTGLLLVLLLAVLTVVGPMIAPKDYREQLPDLALSSPDRTAPFGRDNLGRDILSRILHGAHLTLGVGAGTVLIGLLIGVPLGLISGYFGGAIDQLIMRIIDVMLAFPDYLLALAVMAAFEPNLKNAMIAIGLVFIPKFARIVRGSALTIAENDFVHAARGLGAGNSRILFRHVLPNCIAPIIVVATLGLGNGILYVSALSFLGLGAQPPLPEWGRMLAEAREGFIHAPHVVVFPGIAIMIAVLGINLLGDGLRDALDVRLK